MATKEKNSSRRKDSRSDAQLTQDARSRANGVAPKPETERLPSSGTEQQKPALQTQAVVDDTDGGNAELARQQAEAEAANQAISIALFIILFGFGILTLMGIGALIFYVLDFAASIFEFDLSEYTPYIAGILSLYNLIMSCCGCYGTYRFSELKLETEAKTKEVTRKLDENVQGLGQDNEDLANALKWFEVEITHLEGENRELKQSLQNIEAQEQGILNVRKQEAELFVSLRELWNLYRIWETDETVYRIVRITAEYYRRAYQDGDREHGLNAEQYYSLLHSSVVPRKERKFFPSFDHKVWDTKQRVPQTNEGSILVDELERVLVLIYKEILKSETKVELSQSDKRGMQASMELTEGILLEAQQEEEKKKSGLLSRFFRRDQ